MEQVPARDSGLSNNHHNATSNLLVQQKFPLQETLSRPVEFSRVIGFLFTLFLAVIIALLVFVHERIRTGDGELHKVKERLSLTDAVAGLPLPSQNDVVLQIIFNLLPTAAATLM